MTAAYNVYEIIDRFEPEVATTILMLADGSGPTPAKERLCGLMTRMSLGEIATAIGVEKRALTNWRKSRRPSNKDRDLAEQYALIDLFFDDPWAKCRKPIVQRDLFWTL